MKRLQIAQFIALGATLVSVVGFILQFCGLGNVGMTVAGIGCFVGIISYIFGGFLTALRMSWSIAKWGWFIIPFPYDLLTVIFSFVIAFYAFLFLPIIPVRKAYKNYMGY